MKKFYPVVHIESVDQALRNVGIAVAGKADGAFLIVHGSEEVSTMAERVDLLERTFSAVRSRYPRFWLGVNYLGLSLLEGQKRAHKNLPELQALWSDELLLQRAEFPGEAGNNFLPTPDAIAAELWRLENRVKFKFFGGVAFKGQGLHIANEELVQAVNVATPILDVLTSSGLHTGDPADITKVEMLCEALTAQGCTPPLALASGVDPQNVTGYLPLVDIFMVASGICQKGSFYEFDPAKLADLAWKIGA